MYRLIIADDEESIRNGLAHMIDWETLGFELVGTFQNGEEIIEYLEYMPVDVVLTDVKMPYATGIDVAKYINKNLSGCQIVFMSAYKEFELIKEAMKFGANNYILKPIEMEELKENFERIKQYLDKTQRERHSWKKAISIIEEEFVYNLSMGLLEKEEFIRERMELLFPNLDYDKCPCALVNMAIAEYVEFARDKRNYSMEQYDEAIRNFTRMVSDNAFFYIVYKHKEKISMFVLASEYAANKTESVKLIEEAVKRYSKQFEEIFGMTTYIETKYIYPNVFCVTKRKEFFGVDVNANFMLIEKKKQIMKNIMENHIGVAQIILKSILDDVEQADVGNTKGFIIGLFANIEEMLVDKNKELYSVMSPFLDYKNIEIIENKEDIQEYCAKVFDKLRVVVVGDEKGTSESIIDRVMVYVDKHIMEDIQLETVADQMYVSTSHLARLFKKETGETFLTYLTKKKMEKAVELLKNTGMKVWEVSEKLGYRSVRYFSKLFYGHIGCYPSEYQRMLVDDRRKIENEK